MAGIPPQQALLEPAFQDPAGHREGRGVFFRRKDGFVPRAMVTLLRRHCRSLHGQNQTRQTAEI